MHVLERALWGAVWQIGGKGVLEAEIPVRGPTLGSQGTWRLKTGEAGLGTSKLAGMLAEMGHSVFEGRKED